MNGGGGGGGWAGDGGNIMPAGGRGDGYGAGGGWGGQMDHGGGGMGNQAQVGQRNHVMSENVAGGGGGDIGGEARFLSTSQHTAV